MTMSGWGWKLATDPDDVVNFLSGCGGYTQPIKDAHVTAMWGGGHTAFHCFYQPGDSSQMPASWGWKLSNDPDDVMNFLSGTGAYCQPVKDAHVAACVKDGAPEFYVFYTYELVPARVVDCSIVSTTGPHTEFPRLKLAWTYCVGERPEKLTLSVHRSKGSQWINVMPDKQPFNVARPEVTTEADVLLFQLDKGPHKITFCARYHDRAEIEYTFDRLF